MRPCWSSSAGGRRSGSSSPRPSELPASGAKPIVDRVRADGPLLPGLTLALASGIATALPGAAGAGAARDAAAGPARTARVGRRADPGRGGRWRRDVRRWGGRGRPLARRRTSWHSSRAARAPSATLPDPMVAQGCFAACAPSRRRDGSASAGRCWVPAPGHATNAGSGCWMRDGRRSRRWPPEDRSRAGRSGRARWSRWRSSGRHRPGNCLRPSWLPVTDRPPLPGSSDAASPRPRSASARADHWRSDPPAGVAAVPPRATSCPPRPRRSTGSWLPSPPETRARSCSMA